MCGIVGAAAARNVAPLLIEGLRRLEYRGYDSAGVALLNKERGLVRKRVVGKVSALVRVLDESHDTGCVGVAHTRWATHGVPSERNAHPFTSGGRLALVHNGIIENHRSLRVWLQALGYSFESDTDTEVIVHLVDHCLKSSEGLFEAVCAAMAQLEGAYAIAIMAHSEPGRIVAVCQGAPIIVGLGSGENFLASDPVALLSVTRRLMFLETGDVAEISSTTVQVWNRCGAKIERPVRESRLSMDAIDKGSYPHFMLKEIHEQPRAIADSLSGRVAAGWLLEAAFGGPEVSRILDRTEHVHIIACGTSYHAGCVARYFIERLCRLPCSVEVASEYRYRHPVTVSNSLFVTISQSGETADTLAALRFSKQCGHLASLAICNVPESSLVRESDLALLTRAGPEVGVASTKAFTTQLVALGMLVAALVRRRGGGAQLEHELVEQLVTLPRAVDSALALEPSIQALAERFLDKRHALFLGRGTMYPIAMEGALKLKEISYIQAEAQAAGELKHGPLALVDADMPVVVLAPKSHVLEKLKTNLMEVRARGGRVLVFGDPEAGFASDEGLVSVEMPACLGSYQQPVVYTVALQLLAYHVAVLRGADVDRPRNLAKSVTVE